MGARKEYLATLSAENWNMTYLYAGATFLALAVFIIAIIIVYKEQDCDVERLARLPVDDDQIADSL
jgi:hypothetical protein